MVPGGESPFCLASVEDGLVDAVEYVAGYDMGAGSCLSFDGSCHTRYRPYKTGAGRVKQTRYNRGAVNQSGGFHEAARPYCTEPLVVERGSSRYQVQMTESSG